MYRKLNDVLIASAGNVPKVYDSGHKVGFEEGRQAEYNAFWDGLLNYGNRTMYDYFLHMTKAPMRWFKPKYDICPGSASWFAREWGYGNGEELLDLAEVLKECGVVMDFSKATKTHYLFYNARISHLPEINVSNTTQFDYLMFGTFVKTIDKFIAPQNVAMTKIFGYCSSLENIVFGSEIGGDITMSYCVKLSKVSIESLFEHLSTTTSGLTVTLSKTAVNNAFGINVDDASTYTEEWNNLRNSKSNWTISYV